MMITAQNVEAIYINAIADQQAALRIGDADAWHTAEEKVSAAIAFMRAEIDLGSRVEFPSFTVANA